MTAGFCPSHVGTDGPFPLFPEALFACAFPVGKSQEHFS